MKLLHLAGLSPTELSEFVESLGEPAYRARQIFAGLQHRRLGSFAEMTDIPKKLRAKFSSRSTASTLTVESRYLSADGTRRYLMKTHDNFPVETVFIPEERRDTIGLPSAMHVLSDGAAWSAAKPDGGRDRRTSHHRFERCLWRQCESAARHEFGRYGRGRTISEFRIFDESDPDYG